MRQALLATAALLSLAGVAQAAEVKHVGDPKAMIANAAVVPPGSTTVYVSGITPTATNADAPKETPRVYGDTNTQTMSILNHISALLKDEGMGMGDVVMMRVYLAADPGKGGKMDFAGMNDAFKTFFGTADQPMKPARVTFQVAQLVNPAYFVEIEAQAAKAPAPVTMVKKTVAKTTATTTTTKK